MMIFKRAAKVRQIAGAAKKIEVIILLPT